MKRSELKTVGLSTALVVLNVLFMAGLALTPARQFTNLAFSIPIVGVVVFGALITGGVYLAKSGIRNDSDSKAYGGTAILQFAYAVFGAGIIGFLPQSAYPVVLGATAAVTGVIALLSGLLVYGTDHNFRNWGRYSTYMFLGVFLFAFIGSLSPMVLGIAFLLALGGFITYLVYEIWEMKQEPRKIYLNAIGIYVAFMGVFVQILQIIVEMYLRE
ncbi:MAG: FtsH-binding integral membrane protein [Candidatus Nanohaloarchaea archaeon]|jgi:FtsH-binding integral membrane protein